MECSLINETQQMPLLCQRDPVPWIHPHVPQALRPLPSKTQAINNMHPTKTAKQVGMHS